MLLSELMRALPQHELRGAGNPEIRSIELDSRRVGGGALFVCLEGLARNGHDFAPLAVNQGAAALLVRTPVSVETPVPQVVVADTREAMARVSAAFYDYPARELCAIGVTGTNGKTTVTHLVQSVARMDGRATEVMGTLGATSGEGYRSTGFTTPEAPTFQRVLREAVERGVEWVAAEVSSHALALKRTFGTTFRGAVFTNLTREHLDFHGTMEAYRAAKALLFQRAGRGVDDDAVNVLNLDDEAGVWMVGQSDGRSVTYGFSRGAEYRARRARFSPQGTRYELVSPQGTRKVALPLVGRFNVLNALAAQAVCMELGVSLDTAVAGVEALHRVPGRMDKVPGGHPFLVLVDYAHTPDALTRALEAARAATQGRLTVVFGCGGERDRGKRPEMGRVASERADRVVVTSDNPRGESPETIADEILAGITGTVPVARELDRKAAITKALAGAAAGDTILIAGKGHETEQTIAGVKTPFDDRAVAALALREMGYPGDD